MNFIDLEAEESDIEHAYNIFEENSSNSSLKAFIDNEQQRDSPVLQLRSPLGELPVRDGNLLLDGDRPPDNVGAASVETESSDDEAGDFTTKIKSGENFRISSFWVFCTWAQPRERIEAWKPSLEELKQFCEQKGAVAGIISEEQHRDGSLHFHGLLERRPKWNVRNARFFDFQEVHPNIRSIKKGCWERTEEYVRKDGNTLAWGLRDIPKSSRGYFARKRDRKAWLADIQRSRRRAPPTSIQGMDGQPIRLDASLGKRSGFVLFGRPSLGKSSWFFHEFRNRSFYRPASGANAFDDYDDERVIAWTDPDEFPSKYELCFFTDLGIKNCPASYLKARYNNILCQPGQRFLFILLNTENWFAWPHREEGWFLSRFTVIDCDQIFPQEIDAWECQDSDCEC